MLKARGSSVPGRRFAALASLAVLSVAAILPAAALRASSIGNNTSWTGSVSDVWTNANNWTNGTPIGVFTATIPGSAPGAAVTNLSIPIGALLTIENGGSVTASGVTNNSGTMTLAATSGAAGFYAGAGGTSLVNNSTIQGAGQLVGDTDAHTTGYSLTNNGNITATGSAGLLIQVGGGVTNNGTLSAATGGTLTLAGDTYANTLGTITAATGGAVVLEGATINGGTLTSAGTGVIEVSSAAGANIATFGGPLTISSGSTVAVGAQSLVLDGAATYTNDGTISLASTGGHANIALSGTNSTVTLAGSGVLQMSNSGFNYISAGSSGMTLVNGSTSTIQGSGQLIYQPGDNPYTLNNSGTISAIGSAGLTIQVAAGVTNTGTLQANGGNLFLIGDAYTNTGGTILATNGSVVVLQGSSIAGGTLQTTAGGVIQVSQSAGANVASLSGSLTIAAGSSVDVSGAALYFDGSAAAGGEVYTNNGTVTFGATAKGALALQGTGTVAFAGSGTIQLANGAFVEASRSASGTMTLANGGAIQGSGFFISGIEGPNYNISNSGTITASGGEMAFENGGTLTNTGTLAAASESLLFVTSSANFTNLSGTTLTGGTYAAAGTIEITGLNIVTNAATIDLTGTGKIDDQNGNNALRDFADNTAPGDFSVDGGENFTTAGAFTNAGTVTVGVGDRFTTGASAAYTQTGGLTEVNGILAAAGGFFLNGGTLDGTGAIDGNVTVQPGAVVSPGDAPGTLTIDGTYTMAPTGSFDAGLLSPSVFDALDIDGAADLAGTLNLEALEGFVPVNGETFDIINFVSSEGEFSSVTGTDLGDGYSLSVQYNPTDVVVTVEGPTGTPEPGTMFLFGLGLLALGAGYRSKRGIDRPVGISRPPKGNTTVSCGKA